MNEQTERLEERVREVVGLGRMWAVHGLSIGAQALQASAKSLEVTAGLLGELRAAVEEAAEDVGTGAEAQPPEASPMA